jgi:hypothetical protein
MNIGFQARLLTSLCRQASVMANAITDLDPATAAPLVRWRKALARSLPPPDFPPGPYRSDEDIGRFAGMVDRLIHHLDTSTPPLPDFPRRLADTWHRIQQTTIELEGALPSTARARREVLRRELIFEFSSMSPRD